MTDLRDDMKRALCDSEWINGGWAQIDGIVDALDPVVEDALRRLSQDSEKVERP